VPTTSRHGRTTQIAHATGDIVGTGYLVGHKNATTTNRYIHARKQMAERALTKVAGESLVASFSDSEAEPPAATPPGAWAGDSPRDAGAPREARETQQCAVSGAPWPGCLSARDPRSQSEFRAPGVRREGVNDRGAEPMRDASRGESPAQAPSRDLASDLSCADRTPDALLSALDCGHTLGALSFEAKSAEPLGAAIYTDSIECEEEDLNLHALRQRNLNPPRLPFRHPRVSLRSARVWPLCPTLSTPPAGARLLLA
jgi:hypothetical protein